MTGCVLSQPAELCSMSSSSLISGSGLTHPKHGDQVSLCEPEDLTSNDPGAANEELQLRAGWNHVPTRQCSPFIGTLGARDILLGYEEPLFYLGTWTPQHKGSV